MEKNTTIPVMIPTVLFASDGEHSLHWSSMIVTVGAVVRGIASSDAGLLCNALADVAGQRSTPPVPLQEIQGRQLVPERGAVEPLAAGDADFIVVEVLERFRVDVLVGRAGAFHGRRVVDLGGEARVHEKAERWDLDVWTILTQALCEAERPILTTRGGVRRTVRAGRDTQAVSEGVRAANGAGRLALLPLELARFTVCWLRGGGKAELADGTCLALGLAALVLKRPLRAVLTGGIRHASAVCHRESPGRTQGAIIARGLLDAREGPLRALLALSANALEALLTRLLPGPRPGRRKRRGRVVRVQTEATAGQGARRGLGTEEPFRTGLAVDPVNLIAIRPRRAILTGPGLQAGAVLDHKAPGLAGAADRAGERAGIVRERSRVARKAHASAADLLRLRDARVSSDAVRSSGHGQGRGRVRRAIERRPSTRNRFRGAAIAEEAGWARLAVSRILSIGEGTRFTILTDAIEDGGAFLFHELARGTNRAVRAAAAGVLGREGIVAAGNTLPGDALIAGLTGQLAGAEVSRHSEGRGIIAALDRSRDRAPGGAEQRGLTARDPLDRRCGAEVSLVAFEAVMAVGAIAEAAALAGRADAVAGGVARRGDVLPRRAGGTARAARRPRVRSEALVNNASLANPSTAGKARLALLFRVGGPQQRRRRLQRRLDRRLDRGH
eukprot:scaffold2527_cov241-Pinguiococcus_pyrenoidosus.AAC.6